MPAAASVRPPFAVRKPAESPPPLPLPDEESVLPDEPVDEAAENLSCDTVPPVGDVTSQVGSVRPALSVRLVLNRPQLGSTPP